MAYGRSKAAAYQQTAAQGAAYADPHRQIQMLMEGYISRVQQGRGALQRKDFETKGIEIGKAINIVHGLYDTLDFEHGGEVAANLANLYDYLARETLQASIANDDSRLENVANIMREIKAGWDGIRPAATGQPSTDTSASTPAQA